MTDGCPMCAGVTRKEAYESEGIVLATVEAIAHGDAAQVTALQEAMRPYDYHTACGLYARALLDICRMERVDFHSLLAKYRQELNDNIARSE